MKIKNINVDKIVKHWFTYHPWIKLIALVLAVILWFYIRGELAGAK